ncbi:hypothetical protein ABLT35_13970 [Acinetobacter johnsonii]|jgi:Fe2+ transport system protein B|uniref:hypothetical protein n=2 Tax=Moraxellaceae TaxID=468 RepID=UPI0011E69630|nr:hypothetical protein [Acinetobacter johnsonii]MBP8893163.1 hypothetical protein [Saprospiraceae bacterium]QEK36601.1 hypothetical protein FYN22_12485 [Acinetobacter johnsonii]QSE45208.1 hypothetical protein JW980_13185 [Acinetobacter johnsonii]HRN45105.1 hypothetical protein [Flavobacterium sp.]
MNTQVNNPLYQQFVELVNTTSSGVIEQCVEPLSKTLFESQKEISKIQQYALQLEQQYVDMQKIVETTTHHILDQTIHPVMLQLTELSPELSQAAQAVSGAQQVVEKLQQHSTEIKNKHELLDSVAAEATQKILNDVINPIQKDLLETLPALEKAAVVAVQLEKFTQGLDGLIKQLNLSNQQYSQGLNKTENEINQKISQAEKKLDQLQHSLILQMETLQSQLEQQVNANVQTVQEAHSALKTNSIQNAASLMTKMETFGERLNTSVNTQLSQQEQKLEKRLTLQQNCIWGMLALLVFILLVK